MTVQILGWVIAGGAAVVVSYLCERIPQFTGLSSDAKFYIQLAASCVLAVIAQLCVNYIPAEAFTAIDPYVATIVGIFGVFGINQVAHKLDPRRNAIP